MARTEQQPRPLASRGPSSFVLLWTLAVLATTTAFVLYLAMRVRSVELGYELGRSHARVARLREVRRVLELELSSQKTPERVDLVARTLFGMQAPEPERILSAGKRPEAVSDPEAEQQADSTSPKDPTARGAAP
jgi:cell division protein FtsL